MRSALAVLLLTTCLPLQAAEEQPPFSYLFLNAALTRDRDRDLDVTSEGFSLGGSVDLSEHAFFTVGYSTGDTGVFDAGGASGEVESDGYTLGFGGHTSLTRRTDLASSLAYVHSRTLVRQFGVGGGESEDRAEGAAASLSLRHLIHPWVEFSTGPSYSFVAGERGWNMSAGLGFMMTSKVWMDLDYYHSGGENSDGWSLGLRTVLGGN